MGLEMVPGGLPKEYDLAFAQTRTDRGNNEDSNDLKQPPKYNSTLRPAVTDHLLGGILNLSIKWSEFSIAARRFFRLG